MGTFYLDTDKASTPKKNTLSLVAVFGQTVTRSDRLDCVVASGAVGTQNRNAERLCLHSSTAHTLLFHSIPLQGVHGFTATFAL